MDRVNRSPACCLRRPSLDTITVEGEDIEVKIVPHTSER